MSFQSRSLPRGVKLLLLQRWRAVKPSSRLLLVNTGTCCALYTLGDVVQQKMTCKEEPIDAARTFRMAVLGACMGPLNHYWYVMLDRLLPGVSARIVLKKVVLDQLVMAPLCCSVFYFGMGVLEGRSWKHISREIKEKFWPTYVMDWTIWPAAQIVNFYFVPPSLRVTYVCLVTFGWTVFLSYMKHKKLKAKLSVEGTEYPAVA